MSLFTKGDLVVDQHGESFIVVDEPRLCTITNEWLYKLVPYAFSSVARFESELNYLSKGASLPPDQQALSRNYQVLGEVAPVLAAQPDIWPVFMTAGDALMAEE